MRIETDRLVLRRIDARDFADFCEYYGDAEVSRWLLGRDADDATIRAAFDFNMGLDVCFSVVLKATGRVIGNVHFANIAEGRLAEVGYVLHPNYWGLGLMAEAMRAVTNFAFSNIGLMLLRAVTEAHNDASINLLRRCGFEHEADITDYAYGGRAADVCFYSIRNAGGVS